MAVNWEMRAQNVRDGEQFNNELKTDTAAL